jgi:hypothetical protein
MLELNHEYCNICIGIKTLQPVSWISFEINLNWNVEFSVLLAIFTKMMGKKKSGCFHSFSVSYGKVNSTEMII